MAPPSLRRPLTLDERVSVAEEEIRRIDSDIRALVNGEDRRNDRSRHELEQALEGAKRHMEQVVAALRTENATQSAKLDRILEHSEDAAKERRRRIAREDVKLDEEIREGSRKHTRLMLKVIAGFVAAIAVAWLGAAASHVTEGAHGAGGEQHEHP